MNFTTKPGQRVLCNEEEAVRVLKVVHPVDETHGPHRVRRAGQVHLPPELGGTQATVKHGAQQPCPCGQHETLVLVLDAQHKGKGLRVAECPTHGYLWFVEGGHISGTRWLRIRQDAARRGLAFEITIEEAWALFEHQGRKCALTGLEIHFFEGPKDAHKTTASLDRIDNTKGYLPDNIQWVHKDINMMKGRLTQERFLVLCRAVSQGSTSSSQA